MNVYHTSRRSCLKSPFYSDFSATWSEPYLQTRPKISWPCKHTVKAPVKTKPFYPFRAMADKTPVDENEGQEAVVGVRADVKTLQQLSSSGQAAREKRKINQTERIMGALGDAVKDEVGGGVDSQDRGRK
ncbi:hypothetical protein BO71DRAFT_398969 [Aspergillus ellipticus CBS 707.79]|uniref:Uncharacterized protein n=1 Tax=Aspergillus ellipticus CBS 707.79 TaxID=1448320 RepID=A0A319DA68_9EURO|nr:hypothetical protein BO71DRAFT_398969 [Aspergillus ellipticus CBS 707.79]